LQESHQSRQCYSSAIASMKINLCFQTTELTVEMELR